MFLLGHPNLSHKHRIKFYTKPPGTEGSEQIERHQVCIDLNGIYKIKELVVAYRRPPGCYHWNKYVAAKSFYDIPGDKDPITFWTNLEMNGNPWCLCGNDLQMIGQWNARKIACLTAPSDL